MDRLWLVPLTAVVATGCGSSDPAGFPCDVCKLGSFTCTVGTGPGTATLGNASATGCDGTITGSKETAALWIHCDTKQICVEHATECFPASTTASSFSYTVASKNLTVTCTAK